MNRAALVLGLFCLAAVPLAGGQADALTVAFSVDPATPRLGEPATFTSLAQSPDGNLTNWTWDFGAGEPTYGPVVEHTFGAAGDVVVQLTVLDDQGRVALAGQRVTVVDPAAANAAGFLPPWLYWAMPLLVAGVLFTLAYIVLQRGQPAIYNLVFFFLYVASGLKSLTESFAVLTQPNAGAHAVVLEINESVSYLFGPLFLWFVVVFPRPVHPWLIEGRRGAAALLLAIPFLLNQALGWVPFDQVLNYFNAFISVLALACLGLLIYHAWETDSDEERARIRFLAFTFAVLVLSAIVLATLNIAHAYYDALGVQATAVSLLRAAGVYGLILAPTLEVVAAMVMMYAILRYQLMGIQSLVVKVTRGAVTALMVPSTFIIVGNLIEEVFQSLLLAGVRFDFIIAGFVSALLMVPVQKFTTFVLNKFLPALSAADESARRVEIYATQLRYSLLDGALNDREVQMLQKLAAEIQLRPEELRRATQNLPRASLGSLTLGILGPAADHEGPVPSPSS